MRVRPVDLDRSIEWPNSLDVDGLLSAGWKPHPFRQFVLKLYGRCDLACDYCYVYEMADQRWRGRPAAMSPRTIDLVAARIAEHAVSHALPSVDVTLHGGEPLLAGPDRIGYAVRRIRTIVADRAGADARFNIHTNGVRLSPGYLRLFHELGLRVSVSLDGGEAAHDRHRRRADGRGSHAAVAQGLRELVAEPYRRLFSGLLCVVDLRNPPVETYESLLEFDPPALDFLLPHGNWSRPPPGRDPRSPQTPYADWLIAVFERWKSAPVRRTRIRLFEEIINVLLGGHSTTEGVGLSPVAVIGIETDGAIEQSDMLASAFDGAAATGLHVARDPFDSALRLPGVAARQLGADALSPTCRGCAVRRACGGGLYPHRYRAGEGFANPSVYCRDLYRVIAHIRGGLEDYLATLREPAASGRATPRGQSPA
jgi:uncharacterized protein